MIRAILILAVLGFIGHSYFNGALPIDLLSNHAETPVISNEQGVISILSRKLHFIAFFQLPPNQRLSL